jgi:hypothetical protein
VSFQIFNQSRCEAKPVHLLYKMLFVPPCYSFIDSPAFIFVCYILLLSRKLNARYKGEHTEVLESVLFLCSEFQ